MADNGPIVEVAVASMLVCLLVRVQAPACLPLGQCVLFLGITSSCASLHPGAFINRASEFNTGGIPCKGLASHPSGSDNTTPSYLI